MPKRIRQIIPGNRNRGAAINNRRLGNVKPVAIGADLGLEKMRARADTSRQHMLQYLTAE